MRPVWIVIIAGGLIALMGYLALDVLQNGLASASRHRRQIALVLSEVAP